MGKKPNETAADAQVHENRYVIKSIAGEQTVIRESRQIDLDPFDYAGDLIRPLYDPELLIRLAENSDILQQCVDAYTTNIVGFGFQLQYDSDYDKLEEADKKELDRTWSIYENFFKYCNVDESFSAIMGRVIDDREKIGWGVLEVIENGLGAPAGFEHVPAHKVRLCKRDIAPIPITITILDEDDNPVDIQVFKRFRRFVQIVNEKKVYFKEFGDPRTLNHKTGKYEEGTIPEEQASSMILFENYCSYTEYGLPRYLGQLLNIQGNRKAEELNYTYFSDGRHIPLAVVVENGKLTAESIKMLQDTKGNVARHKFLVLEAEGVAPDLSIGGEDARSAVKIHFEPLVHVLEKDGLFQEYCNNNRAKIRSAFRLHPIYTGESQDYTRATADTARQVTEEQVFQPEREALAFKLNNLLKPALSLTGVSMEFKAPVIANTSEIATALEPYINSGAATPNMLVDALGELLGKQFEQFEGEWANKPLAITLRELTVANAQRLQGLPGSVGEPAGVLKADQVSEIVSALKDLHRLVKEGLVA